MYIDAEWCSPIIFVDKQKMQTRNSMGTALINLFPSCPFPVMRATQEMLEN